MTYAFLTPLLTLATGRFKRFHLVVAYSVVFCVANLVQSLAPTFGVLLASRVLIGAVSGTFWAWASRSSPSSSTRSGRPR